MTAPAVGSRMRVCHSDGYWHYGTLQASEKKGKFCIVFDDDDRIVTALPHRDIQVLAPGAHGSTVGDAPEQAVFHGSFKKRRAKQQVERYAPQETPKDSLDSPRAEARSKPLAEQLKDFSKTPRRFRTRAPTAPAGTLYRRRRRSALLMVRGRPLCGRRHARKPRRRLRIYW